MSATRLTDDDPDVDDMHIARILAMTPEELDAELRAQGLDPEAEAERVRTELDRAIAKVERLRAAGNA